MSEQEPRFYDKSKIPELPKGVRLGSVTSITNCASKYGLYWFFAIHGTRKYINGRGKEVKVLVGEEVAAESAAIGTGVHEYASDVMRGIKVGTPGSKYKKPIDNLNKFIKKYKPEPLLIEQAVYMTCTKCASDADKPHLCSGYAGTLDLVCRIKGKIVLLDWKTSKDLYPDYKMQAEAYYQAIQHMQRTDQLPGIGLIEEMWLVQLDKEKDFDHEKHVMKFKTNGHRFSAFIGLLNYFRWSKVLKSV